MISAAMAAIRARGRHRQQLTMLDDFSPFPGHVGLGRHMAASGA